jgi:hypothetical protein
MALNRVRQVPEIPPFGMAPVLGLVGGPVHAINDFGVW